MRPARYLIPLAAAFAVTACAEEADLNTEYEEQLPAPVQDTTSGEVVPDNSSIEGGADEQVDAQYSGDAVPIEDAPAE